MMTNSTGEEKCSQLVTTAWALWSNRNEIHYGGEGKTGPALALWVANYLQKYWSVMDSCIDVASDPIMHLPDAQQEPLHLTWLPPSASLFKINVDGLFLNQRSKLVLVL